ncbi:hypothetical protein BJ912DRAFT_944871 [Pholiota molesta]|nr:hypothetical protein BJ912DRAFT_944871 [Pholiota molesta]
MPAVLVSAWRLPVIFTFVRCHCACLPEGPSSRAHRGAADVSSSRSARARCCAERASSSRGIDVYGLTQQHSALG